MRHIFQDWRANDGRLRIQIALALFRAAQAPQTRLLELVTKSIYKCYSGVILGIDLPTSVRIGPELQVHHGVGLVVHGSAVIGARVTLRHSTTIGQARPGGGVPSLGDDVDIGANAVIIGDVSVGDGARIGAAAVVIRDVPVGAVAVGNPARNLTSTGGAP